MVAAGEGLRGLKVVDLGLGMAPALAAKFLREAGAEIVRVEPAHGDPFYDVYPAYAVWRRGMQVERAAAQSPERVNALLEDADVCIVGGEDHPAVARRDSAAALQSCHPQLVVLDIEGYPSGTVHAGRPAA